MLFNKTSMQWKGIETTQFTGNVTKIFISPKQRRKDFSGGRIGGFAKTHTEKSSLCVFMFSLVLAGEDFGLKLEKFSRKKTCMLATSLMRCANLRFLPFDFGTFPLRLVYWNATGVIDSPCHFKGSKSVHAKITVVILVTAKITVNSWKLTQVLSLNGNAFETVHFWPVMIRTQRRSLISVLKNPPLVNSFWMRPFKKVWNRNK